MSEIAASADMKLVEEVVAKRMKSKRFIGLPALPVTPCTSALASPSLTYAAV